MHLAAEQGRTNIVKLFLEKGMNTSFLNKSGAGALVLAAGSNRLETVRFLLEQGTLVNLWDFDHWTPLMYAAYADNLDVIKVLIEYDANIYLENNDGEIALDLAEDEEVIMYLESL